MDKTLSTTTTTSEKETHDFMNVDSFSQLPFIRPAPLVKEKSGIRLFGIEFAGGNNSTVVSTGEPESAEEDTTTNNNLNSFDLDSSKINESTVTVTATTTITNGENSRRFECHYCCRNFPTSQALGGHQNAHKRERQHAKRAHLQSSMVHGTSFSDAHHVYNLMNYRFGSTATPPPMPYPTSWNNNNNNINTNSTTSFYGTTSFSHHHHQNHQQQQPINGSPLAFWRIPNNNPSFSHERSLPPLFATEDITNVRASQVVGASGSQNRYVYDSKRGTVHDHVSLDLHL
ncbi:hypothetical protein VNO78_21219 [Psophocarpus tetragonolobus]|uniref:C2H2-type domain-containing protein n=1 Tax=Psophocarpus tetragonolobus TaxID=3891 RepID=A0AAN9SG61_PSOTE